MIVTDSFIFIHLPKTGGTFVTKMLEKVHKAVPSFNVQDLSGLKHAGVKKIPEEYKELPVVINIRNTFEHYVSRYCFNWWDDPKHLKRSVDVTLATKEFPNFPNLTFSEYLRFVNTWDYKIQMVDKNKLVLSENKIGYNAWALTRMTQVKSARFVREMHEMSKGEIKSRFSKYHFLRTENLNKDLFDLLVSSGVPGNKIDFVLEQKPILPKRGGRGKNNTWREHYSEEDIQFVLERDRMLFDLFPYMNP